MRKFEYLHSEVLSLSAVNTPHLTRFGDLLDEWKADAEAAHDAHTTGSRRGPVTGFATLDRELGHALQPGLHFIHGGPGVGKTALALQIAATCGTPALYVSADMGRLDLFRRHTARVTQTFLGRLKSGELTPEASLALAREAAAAAPHLAIADATRAYASPDWIYEKALAVRGEGRYVLIVADSIHSWTEAAPDVGNEYEALNAGIAGLRGLAHALNCPVLAIAEQNRASMAKGGLSAGAGSRKIEYGSETVLDLSKDDKLEGVPVGSTPIKLTLAKNRHGTVGRSFHLTFNPALQSFTERA